LEYNRDRVVIETKSEATKNALYEFNNNIGTDRYYIYPNGQVYFHHVSTVTNAFTFTGNSLWSYLCIWDPGWGITNPPDTAYWIRASATQNPYTAVAGAEKYLFAYWGPNTPPPDTNHTKASFMIVHSPANLHDGGQINFGFTTAGGPMMRWGWANASGDTIALGAGGTEVEDGMIQLGTQGSTVLPNLTTIATCDPIANAYIANPTPPLPASQNILTLANEAVVNQGATMQFSATDAGTWTCPSCAGSISAGGLYTAPATVTAKQTQGGYQLLPNNHVINTRIDSLPVNGNNTAWLNLVNTGQSPLSYHVVDLP